MSKDYSIRLKEVLRGEEVIAEFDRDTGVVTFTEENIKFRAPVINFLKKSGHKPKPPEKRKQFYRPRPPSADMLQRAREMLQKAGQLPADVVGAPVNTTTGQPSLLDYAASGQPLPQGRSMDAPVSAIRAKTYEGSPPLDPDAGDKTPAFVDWLYENHPEDANLRYQTRKTHRT